MLPKSIHPYLRELFSIAPFLMLLWLYVNVPQDQRVDNVPFVYGTLIVTLIASITCALIYRVRTRNNWKRTFHVLPNADTIAWGMISLVGSTVPMNGYTQTVLLVVGSGLCVLAVVIGVRNVYMTQDRFIVS